MVYAIPIEHGRFLIFSPKARAAFVGNAAAAIALRDLRGGLRAPRDTHLKTFFEELGFLASEHPAAASPPSTVRLQMVLGQAQVTTSASQSQLLSLDHACSVIDGVLASATHVGARTVRLIYSGVEVYGERNSLLQLSMNHARRECSRAGLELQVAAELTQRPTPADVRWIITHADIAVIRVEIDPGVDNSMDDDSIASRLVDEVLPTCGRLDTALVPYSLVLALPMFRARAIVSVIRHLSQRTRPVEFRIQALAPEEEVYGDVSREAIDLASALNGVRPICEEAGCELVVPGATLEQPMTLSGASLGDYTLWPDGSLTVVDHAAIERKGCQGCFAEYHCLGGLKPPMNTDRHLPGSARCHLAREVTKETLLSRITRANGIAWSGASDLTSSGTS